MEPRPERPDTPLLLLPDAVLPSFFEPEIFHTSNIKNKPKRNYLVMIGEVVTSLRGIPFLSSELVRPLLVVRADLSNLLELLG